MKNINYGIIGASGVMGKEIENIFNEAGHACVFKFDLNGKWEFGNPDLLIDFSLPAVFDNTIKFAEKFNIPLITGTTGYKDEQMERLISLSNSIPVVQSYNFSIGVQLLLKCIAAIKDEVKEWDIEIEETHHRFKKDKPSGTAIMIKNALRDDVPVSSLRLGNVPGNHTVYFGGLGDVLILEHRALSRRTFAEGVLKAAGFIINKQKGFYSFTDVINNKSD
jgi:4-hydroxy-tetrahydrodipicolinate reductase